MTTYDVSPARASGRADWLATPQAAALVYGLLVVLSVAPVFWWPIPRGSDLVDHWARLTLYHQAPGDPVAGLYRVHFGLIPNLGVDLLYLALWPFVSALGALKTAVALAIALPALGAFAVHRALFDKVSHSIWVAPYLSYNVATTTGLVNFSLGAGVALIAVAYALSRPRGLRARDLVVLNGLGVVIFFCHLIAVAMCWALLAGVLAAPWVEPLRAAFAGVAREQWGEAARGFARAQGGRLMRSAGVAVLAIAAPAILVLLREHSPSNYIIKDLVGISFMLVPVETLTDWDRAFMLILIGLMSLALLPGVRVAPRAIPALAAFTLLCVSVPRYSGAATLIDSRLKVYLWYFAIAVVGFKSEARRELMRPVIAAAALVAIGFRIWAVAPAWDEFNQTALDMREFLKPLPMGSRVLVVRHNECENYRMGTITNLTTFAVIDRRSFVNTLFAQTGMQPVAPTDAMLDGGPTLAMDSYWLDPAQHKKLVPAVLKTQWGQAYMNWRAHFTHVIDAHTVCAATLDQPGLTKINAMPGFDLYKVE